MDLVLNETITCVALDEISQKLYGPEDQKTMIWRDLVLLHVGFLSHVDD